MKQIRPPEQLQDLYKKLNDYRSQKGIGWDQLIWLSFMLLLGTGITLLAIPYSGWPGLLLLVLLILLLAWAGWYWQVIQFSVAAQVFLTVLLLFLDDRQLVFKLVAWSGLLTLLGGAGSLFYLEWRQTRFSLRHVAALFWLAINSSVLLLIIRWLERPAFGLRYAGLPLANTQDSLLLVLVLGLLLFVYYLKHAIQGRANYLLVLPAVVIGVYAIMQLLVSGTLQASLPAAVLEHGLLLIHVPSMLLTLVFILASAGIALLRLTGELGWFRARQNLDVLETIHLSLDEYQHHMLRLIVVLLTVGIISGMAWSSLAWGHYWLWEAKQLLSVSLFLYYLAVLHLQMQARLSRRTSSLLCLLAGLILIAIVHGTNYWLTGLHNFNVY